MSYHREATMTTTDAYECVGCGSTYPSARAAALCCDVECDTPTFARNYELGNN
jgi:hypothetical protein